MTRPWSLSPTGTAYGLASWSTSNSMACRSSVIRLSISSRSSVGLSASISVALDHAVLHLDGAAHGIDNAAELNDAPVAGALHHPTVVHGDGRIDQIASESP